MADAAAAPAVVKTPKKKAAAKPKKADAHPTYLEMIKKAISSLKERSGSSRQAVLKYILANYKVGDNQVAINARIKTALKNGVKNGALKQSKGTGAAGSFRLGEAKKDEKPKKAKAAAKPKKAAKSPKKVKKPAAAKKPKTAAKKAAKSPKKVKAAAKPKKAKTPKKAAAKPKKVKTPKKKAVKPKKA
ncbi:histone 24-like [Haliotis rufescens]|uniref:histone 24-like n=1 Tax=Haliotis rufescens TaxID=6454 RepID=UPI00201EE37F|nr:histone 24-like [Haliotis rufescens]